MCFFCVYLKMDVRVNTFCQVQHVPVLLREREREKLWVPTRVSSCFRGWAQGETAQMLRSAEVFSFAHPRSTSVWKMGLLRATFLCCFVEQRRGWMYVCYGARGKRGVAKAKNWCLWCRYWRKREKNIYIVSCSRCKSMKKKKAVQSCFMCVSHTCIVLRKFVYYTWRFKRYINLYIYIYYNKANILTCPFTNSPSVLVSLNRLPPELLPRVAELVFQFLCLLVFSV